MYYAVVHANVHVTIVTIVYMYIINILINYRRYQKRRMNRHQLMRTIKKQTQNKQQTITTITNIYYIFINYYY